MVGFGDHAFLNGQDIDRHNLKASASMAHAKELLRGSTNRLTAHDHAIVRHKQLLDLKSHIGNELAKTVYTIDGLLAIAALVCKIARAAFES
jgi:hypothetical protein